MTTFDTGETVRIFCQAWDSSGTLADPDTLVLRVQSPSSGTISTFAKSVPADGLIKTSDGHFHKDLVPDASGSWWYEWAATWTGPPPVTQIEPGQFGVRASVIVT